MNELTIVLHIQSLSVGKGGAERVATDLASEMCARDHVVYMAYKNNGEPAYKGDSRIRYLPYKKINDLEADLSVIKPNIFFTFYVNELVIESYQLATKLGVPFGMQECTNPKRLIQKNWRKNSKNTIAENAWEREVVAAGAHAVRLVMPGYANSFPKFMRDNIHAFPNPAFVQRFRKSHLHSEDDGGTIINIGGGKSNKNLIELLKAFSIVNSRIPGWRIHVYGKVPSGKSEYVEEIFDFINLKGLEQCIIFKGPVDDIFQELKDSDIHVISSLEEGCPTCILEAMSVGVPSIGFRECSGTNELIDDHENGLLAGSSDRVAELAIAIEVLMGSRELREKFGANAFQKASLYDPKSIYDKWENLFFSASAHGNSSSLLFSTQSAVDFERASHALRMRRRLYFKS
jgi:glycosyltransferase involved in cell wall biosynthesis